MPHFTIYTKWWPFINMWNNFFLFWKVEIPDKPMPSQNCINVNIVDLKNNFFKRSVTVFFNYFFSIVNNFMQSGSIFLLYIEIFGGKFFSKAN